MSNHPTTPEPDYTQDEIEFMASMHAWTAETGRKFPAPGAPRPAYTGSKPLGEPDYTQDEIEFMASMHAWTAETGRKFPTFTETLRVAKNLGYERVRDTDMNA